MHLPFFFQVCHDDENEAHSSVEDDSTPIKLEDEFDLGRSEVILAGNAKVTVHEAVRRADNKPVTLFVMSSNEGDASSTRILGYKKPIRQFSSLTNEEAGEMSDSGKKVTGNVLNNPTYRTVKQYVCGIAV